MSAISVLPGWSVMLLLSGPGALDDSRGQRPELECVGQRGVGSCVKCLQERSGLQEWQCLHTS